MDRPVSREEPDPPSPEGLVAGPVRGKGSWPAPEPKLPRRLGDYELLEEIGRGGMGVVYRARHLGLDRLVALKILRGYAGGSVDPLAFVSEAQVTGQLEHPNIVPVHEIGTDEQGSPYFVMKLVGGRSLSEILIDLRGGDPQAHRAFGLERLLDIFCEIGQAVAFAHAKGILHRDLKPSNVMVGDFGEVLVMDWGLAKCIGSVAQGGAGAAPPGGSASESEPPRVPLSPITVRQPATQAGMVAGTPEYMSPEQASGDAAAMGPRSDVYSLGAMLFEMLSYRPPHMDRDTRVLIQKVATERAVFPPAGGFRPRVSKALRAVTLKALAPDLNERYGSVLELVQDVRAVLEHRPVTACPDTLLDKASRLLRRHGPLVGTIAGALILILAGAAIAFRQLGLAAREKAENEEQLRVQSEKAVSAENDRRMAIERQMAALGQAREEERKRQEAEKIIAVANDRLVRSMASFLDAYDLLDRRQYRAALKELQRISEIAPPLSPILRPTYYQMGLAHYEGFRDQENAKLAIEYLKKADDVARHNNTGRGDPRALLKAGEVAWTRLHDPLLAEEFFASAARQDPGNPFTILGSAYVHVMRARRPEIKDDPAAVKREAAAALERILHVIALRARLLEAHFMAGLIYAGIEFPESGLKDLKKAYEQFTLALELNANHLDSYLQRAATGEQLSRALEALEDYDNALRIRPGEAKALLARGRLLAVLGRLEEAESDLVAAEKRSTEYEVYLALGQVWTRLKKWGPAEELLGKAVARWPERFEPRLLRAQCRLQLARHEQALADAGELLRQNPGHAEALRIGAEAKRQLRQIDAAVRDFQTLLEGPGQQAHLEAWKPYGELLLEQNRRPAAISALRTYLSHFPRDQEVRLRLTGLLYRDPQAEGFAPQEAVRLAREAQAVGGQKDPRVWVALSESLLANGQVQEALQTIEAAYSDHDLMQEPEVRACRERIRQKGAPRHDKGRSAVEKSPAPPKR